MNSAMFNPLPDDKNLDWSKLKQFADDNFKIDENSRNFSKWVENTVGKGEIAPYEQFLLFPLCFQELYFPGVSKGVTVWEWYNPFPNKPWFLPFCKCKSFENAVGKGETSNFSFSLSVFYTFGKISAIFIKFKIVVCKLF